MKLLVSFVQQQKDTMTFFPFEFIKQISCFAQIMSINIEMFFISLEKWGVIDGSLFNLGPSIAITLADWISKDSKTLVNIILHCGKKLLWLKSLKTSKELWDNMF